MGVEVLKKGKVSIASEILFPGCLFIRITELSSSVSAIQSTKGVLNFISFVKSIPRVPISLILELKNKINM